MSVFPLEIYKKILAYASYDDLLILREVNGDFSDLVDRVLSTGTVWVKRNNDHIPLHRLFYTDEYVHVDRCFLSRSLLGFKLSIDLHSKIKKLILPDPYLLSSLTNLESLTHLELVSPTKLDLNGDIVLKGRNLRILNIQLNGVMRGKQDSRRTEQAIRCRIAIDCCKLTHLKSDLHLEHFKFLYVDSLEHLDCYENTPTVNQFTNLRKLVCCRFNYDHAFNWTRKLEHLSFNFTMGKTAELKQLFDSLVDRLNLNIFYRNINYTANRLENGLVFDLSKVQTYNDVFAQVYTAHLDHIEDGGLTSIMNYELNTNLNLLPVKLIAKLTSVRFLQVNNIVEREKWTQVLSSTSLEKMHIHSCMSQRDYDLIPNYVPNLIELQIRRFDNLDFVLQLRYLFSLRCHKYFDLGLLRSMIARLRYLGEIVIRNEYCITIEDKRVRCLLNGLLMLNEPMDVFQTTLHCVRSWSEIFHN